VAPATLLGYEGRAGADVLATAQESSYGGHQLFGLLGALAGVGVDDAVGGVLVEQPQGDLVQRGLDGGDLGEHVDAVAVLVDHLLHAADLPLDAPQSRLKLVLGGAVAARGRRELSFGGGLCAGPRRRVLVRLLAMRQFRFVFLANSDVRLMERAADPAASFRFELGSEGTALVRDVVEDHQGVPCHKLLNLQVTCERPDLDDATMAHARAVAETILLLLSAIARAPTGDVEFFVAYEITPGAVDRALLQWLPAPELPEPRTPAPHELLDEVWMKLHAAAEREPSLTERIVLSMSWYRRALRETEVLFRFSNLWLALEALNPRLCDYFNIPSAQRGGLPGLRQLLDEVAGTGAFAQAVQARNDLLHVNRVRPDTIRALVEPIIRELDDAVVEGWGRLLEVAKDTRAAPSSSVWPYPNRYVLRATVRPDTEGWSENRHPWFDQIIALKLRQPARPGSITYDQSPTWTPHNVATAQLLSYEARGAETPNPPRSEGPGEIHVMRGKPTDDEQPSGHNEARDSTPGNAPSRAHAGGGATLRAMSKLNAA
jgi:hypothetical protein